MTKGETILKLTREPSWSYDPKETYRIIRTKKGLYFGQYTKGKGLYDKQSKKVHCETELDTSIIEQLFDYMRDMHIPAFTDPLMVCDGAYYELKIGDDSSRSVFRWFYSLPEDHPWMPLQILAETISRCVPSEPPLPVACPKCKSNNIIPILYGMPTGETFEQAERGELILGGCCQELDAPDHHCKDCRHQWIVPIIPLFPRKHLLKLALPVEFVGTPPDDYDPSRDSLLPPDHMGIDSFVTFHRPAKNQLQINPIPNTLRWARADKIYQVEKGRRSGGYVFRQVASGGVHYISVQAMRRIRGHGLTVEPSEAYGFLIGWPERREILAALPVGRTCVYHERSDLFAAVVAAFPQARDLAVVRGLAVMGLYCAARERDFYDITQRVPPFFREDCLLMVPGYGTGWYADILTRPAPPYERQPVPWEFSHRRIESASLNPKRIHSE